MKIKIDFKNKSCTWLLYKVTIYGPELQCQLNKRVGKHHFKRTSNCFWFDILTEVLSVCLQARHTEVLHDVDFYLQTVSIQA